MGTNWKQLPPCLALHGIPPEPAGSLTEPLWRRCDCQQANQMQEAPDELHGGIRLAWDEVHTWLQDELAQQPLPNKVEDLTLRQVVQWLWRIPRGTNLGCGTR